MNHCRQRKPDASKEWLSKLPQLAHRLEESLYRSALSFEAYNDISTLKQRLEQLAINVGIKTKRIQAAQQPGGQAAHPSTHQSEEVLKKKTKKKLSSIAARAMAALEDEDDVIELSSDDDDDEPPSCCQVPTDTLKGQSHAEQQQQKWDDMFQCLLSFIEETRKEKSKLMNDEQMIAWVWDGKVPQHYKTPSGKPLGKWINTQRQAKKNGTLKDDREARLTNNGLRWGNWNYSDTTNAVTNTQEKCNHPGGCLYPAIEGQGLCLNHYKPPQSAAQQQSQNKDSPLNGGWQSDDDMEDRRKMITNM